ncbi:MAG: hypothetical protein HF308_19135, partial [Ignavibacteria bacterium]|nr:hypothetical protein [Ignavibacteria bacterium]MCU7526595.1 hypothetical protein [Ignavibacteria bacterium]
MQEIQNKLIKDYGINIVKSCECLSRGHAHVDGTRRICNWKQEENIGSTFTLLHEIGHIETFKSSMRRAE